MITAYLKLDEIKEGMFSSEDIIIVKDYQGEKQSGFFDKSYVHEEGLEVIVFNMMEDWAWVKPNGGYFCERDQGIPVHKSDLNGIRYG